MIIGPHYAGIITPDPMQLVVPISFKRGRLRTQVVRNGTLFYDSGFVPQVMTNSFFESYLSGNTSRSQLLSFAGVGTDIADALATDTTITQVGPRAAANSTESSASVAGNVITQRVQYRWNQGEITVPITSAALFAALSGGATNVRQRLKDSGGSNTSVPLTSMDALYLTWEVDSVVDLNDITPVVTYGGVSYNVILRPSLWTSDATTNPVNCGNPFAAFAGGNSPINLFGFSSAIAYGTGSTLGSVTGVPGSGSATPAGVSNTSIAAYVASSRQRTCSYTWESNAGNALGGIRNIKLSAASGAGYQMSFAAVSGGGPIPKDETRRFRLDVTYHYDT